MRQTENNGDRQLIAKAKAGDMMAYEDLIRKYQRIIYGLCRRLAGDVQSADDLSQETFIKAYFSLHGFKDGMNFFTWIRKIAVNNCLNYIKKRKREEPLGARENTVTANLDGSQPELPQEKLQRKFMESKFSEALEALPLEYKTVFILRVFENLSYKDISEMLNIPEGTVMSRLSRTRNKLKTLLAEYL